MACHFRSAGGEGAEHSPGRSVPRDLSTSAPAITRAQSNHGACASPANAAPHPTAGEDGIGSVRLPPRCAASIELGEGLAGRRRNRQWHGASVLIIALLVTDRPSERHPRRWQCNSTGCGQWWSAARMVRPCRTLAALGRSLCRLGAAPARRAGSAVRRSAVDPDSAATRQRPSLRSRGGDRGSNPGGNGSRPPGDSGVAS